MRNLLIVLGCVVGLLVGAVLLLAFNLNGLLDRNRDVLENRLEAAIGRPVSFEALRVGIASGLAIRIVDLHVGEDPALASQDFLSADDVYVGIRILPALKGRIEMDRIELRAPSITLIQTAKGLSTDSLGGGSAPAAGASGEAPTSSPGEAPASSPVEAPAASPVDFQVSSVEIRDGTLRLIDRQVSPPSETRISALSLSARDVSRDRPIPFELAAAVLGAESPDLKVSGTLGPLNADVLRIQFDVRGDPLRIGENVLRGMRAAGTLDLPAAGPQGSATLAATSGSVGDVPFEDLDAKLRLTGSRADAETLSLRAFGGNLEASAFRDAKNALRPAVGLRAEATGMSVERILASQSPGSVGFLTGTLDADTDVRGSGASWTDIEPGLKGSGGFAIRDGVIRDFNPAGPTLRAVMSIPAITERKVMEVFSKYPNVFGVGDTPFSRMDGRVEIRDAAVFVRDFVLRTAEYDLVGGGRYGLDGAVEFRTALVFSDKLSRELIESTSTMRYLRNAQNRVSFPVDVRGTTTKLAVVPDVTAVATAASREALRGALDRALDIDEPDAKPGDPPKDPSTKDIGRDILRRGIDDLLRP